MLEKTNADLHLLACNQGLKVSGQIQGQGSCDLSKDAIICKINEKKYIDQSIPNTTSQIDAEKFTIYENCCLLNFMFMDETIELSDECSSLATKGELDMSQVGANSSYMGSSGFQIH